jgi:hypothetical protein
MTRTALTALASKRSDVGIWKTDRQHGYRDHAAWGIVRRECRRAERRLGRALCADALTEHQPTPITIFVGGQHTLAE